MLKSVPARRLLALTIAPVFFLAACSSGDSSADTSDSAEGTESSAAADEGTEAEASGTVTITDNYGEVEVPVNPASVVALDNHVFQTLSDWDVELVAAPKGIMGTVWPEYTEDESVADVGNHGEPDLEAVIAASPELIIGGYRFQSYYDDLVAQNPGSVVIDLAPREGEDAVTELQRQTTALGEIFGHEDEAAALNEELDSAIASASENYNGTDTVVGLITSGGEISYAAPGSGRSVGPVFTALGLTPAIETEAEDPTHGDDISVEAIAEANPDWIIVLDRDGAVPPEGEYVPATSVIEDSEALAGVTAVQEGQIIVLDPAFYLTEDIQSYTTLYSQIADAFGSAS